MRMITGRLLTGNTSLTVCGAWTHISHPACAQSHLLNKLTNVILTAWRCGGGKPPLYPFYRQGNQGSGKKSDSPWWGSDSKGPCCPSHPDLFLCPSRARTFPLSRCWVAAFRCPLSPCSQGQTLCLFSLLRFTKPSGVSATIISFWQTRTLRPREESSD